MRQADFQVEIMDILITAMEKFHWDHTSISDYLKRELDTRYGCSRYGSRYGCLTQGMAAPGMSSPGKSMDSTSTSR